MLETDYAGSGKILVQGHRGALGHAPENTMPSFEKGLELGADVIELDVHLSADGRLVVMHDPDVSRTTNGKGRISAMNAEGILALDAGVRFSPLFEGTRVPLLEEVLGWAKGKIDLVIEIKGDPFPAAGIERKILDEVSRWGMREHVLIISFYHDCVRRIKEIDGSVPTGILYTGRPVDPVSMAKNALADSFRCDWRYLHKDDVRKAHEANLWVGCWTANSEDVFSHLADLGVDSAGCDYPDRFRSWLDRNGLGVVRP